MKKISIILSSILIFLAFSASAQSQWHINEPQIESPEIPSQWAGKKVAFIGDSITDERQVEAWGCNDTYWNMMSCILGTVPYVYAISGQQMDAVIPQGERLEQEHGQDIDAIIVFYGTNDFNASLPMGEWYTYSTETVNKDGIDTDLCHREPVFGDETFCARTNSAMRWLKKHYPTKQIIFMTPIHRGYANLADTNVQPDEYYSNKEGLFLEDYVNAIKEACSMWSIPCIDLYSISGLNPMIEEQYPVLRDPYQEPGSARVDRLHPNTPGHRRLAYTISYQLLSLPVSF